MIHPRFPNRRAASRLDLLVGLIVFLTALGLFITFIFRGRGKADQVKCAYHLKLQGEGIYWFANQKVQNKGPRRPAYDFLPPARIDAAHATWPVLLAPYLEAKGPLLGWDLESTFAGQPEEARNAVVSYYFCPSRPRPAYFGVYEAMADAPLSGAFGDYGAVSGNGDPKYPWDGPAANGALILGEVLEQKGDKILRWRGRTDLNQLPRGQSVTLLVGEKHVPLPLLGQLEGGDGSIYDARFPASFARIGGVGYPLAMTPNDPFNLNFGSCHPNLVQFLVADGSVTGYTTSISPDILGRLTNRFE